MKVYAGAGEYLHFYNSILMNKIKECFVYHHTTTGHLLSFNSIHVT